MAVETKRCGKCGDIKPLKAFSKDKNRADGRYVQCKACRRQWYTDNKVLVAERGRQHRLTHPERQLFEKARARARKLGIPFTILPEDIIVPSVCPVLGIPLVINAGIFGPDSPTLDRVKPSLGYIPGNIVVMSFRANLIKNDASVEDLEKVLAWMKVQEA